MFTFTKQPHVLYELIGGGLVQGHVNITILPAVLLTSAISL